MKAASTAFDSSAAINRERDEPTTQFMAEQLPGKEVIPVWVEQGQASHEHRDAANDRSHLPFILLFSDQKILVKPHTLRIVYTTEAARGRYLRGC